MPRPNNTILLSADSDHGSDGASDNEGAEDIDAPPSPADVKQNIKQKYLTEMPQDFYDFWEFCQQENKKNPQSKMFKFFCVLCISSLNCIVLYLTI